MCQSSLQDQTANSVRRHRDVIGRGLKKKGPPLT